MTYMITFDLMEDFKIKARYDDYWVMNMLCEKYLN